MYTQKNINNSRGIACHCSSCILRRIHISMYHKFYSRFTLNSFSYYEKTFNCAVSIKILQLECSCILQKKR